MLIYVRAHRWISVSGPLSVVRTISGYPKSISGDHSTAYSARTSSSSSATATLSTAVSTATLFTRGARQANVYLCTAGYLHQRWYRPSNPYACSNRHHRHTHREQCKIGIYSQIFPIHRKKLFILSNLCSMGHSFH